MCCSRQSLGEEVSRIVGDGNLDNADELLPHPVSDMMNSNVDMFRALIVHGVVLQVCCSSVVEVQWNICENTESF